jgi:hypothetical protein
MIVYKITNKINGKVYIGQTILVLNQRWAKHKSDTKRGSNCSIHNALRKYGFDNFTIEEIDGANNQTELNYKEYLQIHLNNSLYPSGYNLKTGGNKISMSDFTKNKIKNIVKNNFTKEHHAKMIVKSIEKQGKKIKATCLETNKEYFFNSIAECSSLNLSHKHVQAVLSGKRPYKPIKGFLFEVVKKQVSVENVIFKKPFPCNNIKFIYYSSNDGCTFKKEGTSVDLKEKYCVSFINKHIKGIKKSAYGKFWKRELIKKQTTTPEQMIARNQ